MKTLVKSWMSVLSVLLMTVFLVPTGAMAVEEIKIGVIYPLTGGTAAAGRELRAGAELAAEIANNTMREMIPFEKSLVFGGKLEQKQFGRKCSHRDLRDSSTIVEYKVYCRPLTPQTTDNIIKIFPE